jgi:hypothetical protein
LTSPAISGTSTPARFPAVFATRTFDENGCDTVSSTVGRVIYSPPLANPEQEAPAFALSMTVTPQPVGVERGTVTIDFSRPMSVTALPAVSFHDVRLGRRSRSFQHGKRYSAGCPWTVVVWPV